MLEIGKIKFKKENVENSKLGPVALRIYRKNSRNPKNPTEMARKVNTYTTQGHNGKTVRNTETFPCAMRVQKDEEI